MSFNQLQDLLHAAMCRTPHLTDAAVHGSEATVGPSPAVADAARCDATASVWPLSQCALFAGHNGYHLYDVRGGA